MEKKFLQSKQFKKTHHCFKLTWGMFPNIDPRSFFKMLVFHFAIFFFKKEMSVVIRKLWYDYNWLFVVWFESTFLFFFFLFSFVFWIKSIVFSKLSKILQKQIEISHGGIILIELLINSYFWSLFHTIFLLLLFFLFFLFYSLFIFMLNQTALLQWLRLVIGTGDI